MRGLGRSSSGNFRNPSTRDNRFTCAQGPFVRMSCHAKARPPCTRGRVPFREATHGRM